jgi:hypothetical protein
MRACRLLVDWLGFLLDRFKATQRCKTINGYTKNVDKAKRVVDYLLSTDNPTPERANHLRSVRAMLEKVGADVAHSYRSGMHRPKLVVSNPAPALGAGPDADAPESEDMLPDKEALLRFQRRLQKVSSRAQRCMHALMPPGQPSDLSGTCRHLQLPDGACELSRVGFGTLPHCDQCLGVPWEGTPLNEAQACDLSRGAHCRRRCSRGQLSAPARTWCSRTQMPRS